MPKVELNAATFSPVLIDAASGLLDKLRELHGNKHFKLSKEQSHQFDHLVYLLYALTSARQLTIQDDRLACPGLPVTGFVSFTNKYKRRSKYARYPVIPAKPESAGEYTFTCDLSNVLNAIALIERDGVRPGLLNELLCVLAPFKTEVQELLGNQEGMHPGLAEIAECLQWRSRPQVASTTVQERPSLQVAGDDHAFRAPRPASSNPFLVTDEEFNSTSQPENGFQLATAADLGSSKQGPFVRAAMGRLTANAVAEYGVALGKFSASKSHPAHRAERAIGYVLSVAPFVGAAVQQVAKDVTSKTVKLYIQREAKKKIDVLGSFKTFEAANEAVLKRIYTMYEPQMEMLNIASRQTLGHAVAATIYTIYADLAAAAQHNESVYQLLDSPLLIDYLTVLVTSKDSPYGIAHREIRRANGDKLYADSFFRKTALCLDAQSDTAAPHPFAMPVDESVPSQEVFALPTDRPDKYGVRPASKAEIDSVHARPIVEVEFSSAKTKMWWDTVPTSQNYVGCIMSRLAKKTSDTDNADEFLTTLNHGSDVPSSSDEQSPNEMDEVLDIMERWGHDPSEFREYRPPAKSSSALLSQASQPACLSISSFYS